MKNVFNIQGINGILIIALLTSHVLLTSCDDDDYGKGGGSNVNQNDKNDDDDNNDDNLQAGSFKVTATGDLERVIEGTFAYYEAFVDEYGKELWIDLLIDPPGEGGYSSDFVSISIDNEDGGEVTPGTYPISHYTDNWNASVELSFADGHWFYGPTLEGESQGNVVITSRTANTINGRIENALVTGIDLNDEEILEVIVSGQFSAIAIE